MIARALLVAGLAAAALAVPSAAPAQNYSELMAARRAGQIGERFDGYLGFAGAASAAARSQASAINIRRRALYVDLARKRGVIPHDVGVATACELLRDIGVGEAYMLPDGVWRRRQAGGPPPVPAYCG